MDEDDAHYSHLGLQIPDCDAFSITKCHNPLTNLHRHIKESKSVSVHQSNNEKNATTLCHSSKDSSKSIKALFKSQFKKDPHTELEGWNWKAIVGSRHHHPLLHASFGAPPPPSLIDLEPFVALVVVHHSVRPVLSKLPGGTQCGNIQERPMVRTGIQAYEAITFFASFKIQRAQGYDKTAICMHAWGNCYIPAATAALSFNAQPLIIKGNKKC